METEMYAVQVMALTDEEDSEKEPESTEVPKSTGAPKSTEAPAETDEDVVDGRKFQYQNLSPENIKVTPEGELFSKYSLKVELDELVIFDFDGKASTKEDRLSLSGEVNIEDVNAIVGLEMHSKKFSLNPVIIPNQIITKLYYTQNNQLKVSYGGKAEIKDLIEALKLGFDNKAEVRLLGQDVEIEGIDTEGKIYLASVGINLTTATVCCIKGMESKLEPMVVINLYETLEGSIEAKASISIQDSTYYENGFNFQQVGFESNLVNDDNKQGTKNISITIPALSSWGKESEYELNIYDIKGKSKEEPFETPEWSVNAVINGESTLSSGIGVGVGIMICGIIPATFDANLGIKNRLAGDGTVTLSNYGEEKDYRFDLLGKKIYSTVEGEYEFYSKLAFTAKPDFRLAVCMDDETVADVTLPEVSLVDITLFEGGLSSQKFEGVVQDSVTNLPVPNAKVALKKNNSTGWGNQYETVTDEKGCFTLSNILVADDATFELTITKQDYVTEQHTIAADDIGGDAKVYPMVCTLEHPYVKGTVSIAAEDGSAGEPLYYAIVRYDGITGTDTEGESGSSRTDSKGVFDIGYLPEGEYEVTVSRIGYKPQTAKVTLVMNESGNTDFVLEKDVVKFSGHVYYESDEGEQFAVEAAMVKLTRTVGDIEEIYTVKTDNNGYFEFDEVLASGSITQDLGGYALTVEAGGYKAYTSTIIADADLQRDIILIGKEAVSLQECSVVLSQDSFTYDGTAKEPTVTVELDGDVIDAENYTLSYENNINAGTASVIITANEGSALIKDTITLNFTIEAIPVEISEIALFREHSAGVTADGDLYVWGRNYFGQIGDGTTADRSVPIKVLENVKAVSGAFGTTAAITEDNDLYIWGLISFGEGNYTSKTPIKLLEDVQQVVCGDAHTGIITNDNSLYLVGSNRWGQIGDGTTTEKRTPVKVLDNVIKVDCTSTYNTGALTADGSLYIWGYNKHGQIGDGTTKDKHIPMKVLDNVKDFWMSQYVSLALMEDGTLYMWGYEISELPKKFLENVKVVSRGGVFTGAITEDGTLYTWGQNNYGQLGIGGTSDKDTPVKVLDNIEQIECFNYYHTAAITQDGSLYMWGYNGNGEIGDGTTEHRYVPCKILDNVQKVTSGWHHVAAILNSGEIYIWGGNTYGQLGNCSYENCGTPTLLEVYNYGSVSVED